MLYLLYVFYPKIRIMLKYKLTQQRLLSFNICIFNNDIILITDYYLFLYFTIHFQYAFPNGFFSINARLCIITSIIYLLLQKNQQIGSFFY